MTKAQIKATLRALEYKRQGLLLAARSVAEDPAFEDNIQEIEMEIDEINQCAAALSRLTPTDL